KPTPTPVIEVIDLARAYEPVREPEEPAGAVNPASFIQVPEGPQRIPPAIDLDNPYADVIQTIEKTGPLMWNGKRVERIDFMPWAISGLGLPVERLMVMPRDVTRIEAIRRFQERSRMFESPPGGFEIQNTWPLFESNVIPSVAAPVEQLKVMPREWIVIQR